MIWEPFVLALVLGLVVSGGLYFAYLWPSVEPLDDGEVALPLEPALAGAHSIPGATGDAPDSDEEDEEDAAGAEADAVQDSKAEAAVTDKNDDKKDEAS